MTKPFSGVRVLDFAQVFAGPFCSYQLALLGADVIKIEPPGGEDMRKSPPSKAWADRGMAPLWLSVNANKRAITLNLKDPRAIDIAKRLVAGRDVVTENYRPGVMERFGLGYETLSEINPRLIYCAMSGFGQDGPARDTPAYDGRIQAATGIMSITGHEDGGPLRAGFAVCDAITGMTGAFALASALFQRTHTGRGQMIDVAMFDATLSFLSPVVAEYTIAGVQHRPYGNQAVSRRPTANLFRVKDGYILLACNNEKQYQKLMRVIGRADALDDPRFADWDLRIENEPALRAIIEEAFASDDDRTWEARLSKADAPASCINTIADAVNHPQLAHRDVLQTTEGPEGPMTLIGSGFKLAHGGGSIEQPPAPPGAHSDEILRDEIGLSNDDIATLRADGVI